MLAASAVVFLGLGIFPQEPLRRLAEGRLQAALGGRSGLGGLRVVPFLLKAELRDLRVEGPGYALDVPEADVVLAPRALTGALAFQRVEIERPVLRLAPADEPPDEADTAPLAPVEIEALAIRGATVHWNSPGNGRLTVEEMTVRPSYGVKLCTGPKSGKSRATQMQVLRETFDGLRMYLDDLIATERDERGHAEREALFQGREFEGDDDVAGGGHTQLTHEHEVHDERTHEGASRIRSVEHRERRAGGSSQQPEDRNRGAPGVAVR